MADITRRQEARALDAEEREMLAATYHPAVQALADADLATLVARVRDRRDRAQTITRQRRREIRGKAVPHGTTPARDNTGNQVKAGILADAMRRLNGEQERRQRMRARLLLIENQQRALVQKQAAGHADLPPNSRTAHEGMRRNANARSRRTGSAAEAGRASQFVKAAQAKKDARGG